MRPPGYHNARCIATPELGYRTARLTQQGLGSSKNLITQQVFVYFVLTMRAYPKCEACAHGIQFRALYIFNINSAYIM